VIDTHAHLSELEDPSAAMARARAAGVQRVIAIASTREAAWETLSLAKHEEGVFAAIGIHPHEAGRHDGGGVDLQPLHQGKAIALGEIGLDFFRDYAPREDQRRVFSGQLQFASMINRPVIVHSRAADEETASLLQDFDGTVVLHCFSSPGLLPVALERGYYVSFAGNVTYPNAVELREAATQVPADRILAETDSPYLAPQPVRGKTNEPAFVVHTVATLAEVRGEDAERLAKQIDENASAAFGLP
jgi:TatD DNase family protein